MAGELSVLGESITVRVASGEHAGRYAVVEEVTQPGAGPPLHRHSREDEIFHVVEGRIRVRRGDRDLDLGRGDIAVLPRGEAHTFVNVGAGPSRVMVTIVPGGFEGFFEAVDAEGLQVPRDGDRVTELAAEYGLEIVGPPLGID